MKQTAVRFTPQEAALLEEIRKVNGLPSRASALRFVIRNAGNFELPHVRKSMKITMTEKKLDGLIKQLLRAVIRFAKTSGYDKPGFTCLVHDLWGDEED